MKNIAILIQAAAVSLPTLASPLIVTCTTPPNVDAMITVQLFGNEQGSGNLLISVGNHDERDYGQFTNDDGISYHGDNYFFDRP